MFLFMREQKTGMLLFNENSLLIFKSNTNKDVSLTKYLSKVRFQHWTSKLYENTQYKIELREIFNLSASHC
jgi:hypothetical protein